MVIFLIKIKLYFWSKMKVKVEYGDIFSQKWFHNWLEKKFHF